MATTTHTDYESLHDHVERVVGADLRLVYGLGVPFGIATVLIIALLVTNATWLLPLVMLVVIAMVGVICVGLAQMLDEGND